MTSESSPPSVNLSATCSLTGAEVRIKSPDAGRNVFRFLGVPYAQPPIGDLRFCDPQPLPLWDGCRKATEFGPVCPQDFDVLKMMPVPIERPERVSEDCLYLNIWTSTVKSDSKLPVMFWIHGGGFIQGFSNLYDGGAITTFHDIVFVSINYRLGPFGFMCMDNSATPRNQGLMDQLAALSWIQKHIHHFGGDPDNVTIFGESAGGVSVSLLVLSQLSQGLFRRAISQSGTALFSCLLRLPERIAKHVKDTLVTAGGKSDATIDEFTKFARELPAAELSKLFPDRLVPVVDGRVISRDVWSLNVTLFEEQKQQQYVCRAGPPIDYLQGCNSDEGVFMLDYMKVKFQGDLDSLTGPATREGLLQSGALWFPESSDSTKLLDAVWQEYFGSDEPDATLCQQGIAGFVADVMFLVPALRLSDLHSAVAKMYVYSYRHRTAHTPYPSWVTAAHGAEILLMMGLIFNDPLMSAIEVSDEDRQLSRRMMAYWTNFAKTGNPNGSGLIEWPQYDVTERRHLVFKASHEEVCRLKTDRLQFWQKTLKELQGATASIKTADS